MSGEYAPEIDLVALRLLVKLIRQIAHPLATPYVHRSGTIQMGFLGGGYRAEVQRRVFLYDWRVSTLISGRKGGFLSMYAFRNGSRDPNEFKS